MTELSFPQSEAAACAVAGERDLLGFTTDHDPDAAANIELAIVEITDKQVGPDPE